MTRRPLALLGALIGCALAFAPPARAQTQPRERPPSRIEAIPVRSTTLTGEEFLRGGAPGREVWLAGELRLPPGAAARVPAVVMVHGSGGISGSADLWARELNSVGVAAFILDSFSGRGITSTVEDQDQLHSLAMMVDAYRALDRLAQHPRIRADRIAVMGFSKGAVASIYSASERFRQMHGGERRFAAHIGLYTPCNVRYGGDTQVSPVPIRFHHGTADDYVPVAPCRDYVRRLREAGADATLAEYPNGQHGFDSPLSAPLVPVPTAQSTRNCALEEGEGGVVRVVGTSEPYVLRTAACVARGAHVGHDAAGEAAVKAAVKDFLRDALLR